MKAERDLITRAARAWAPTEPSLDDLDRRRRRKERNRRLGAILVAAVIMISLAASGIAIIRSEAVPADQPTTPNTFRRDGEFIVFAPSTGAGWDVAAQDPESGDVRTIVETDGIVDCVVADEPCTTFIKEAEWSADGRWVAFRVSHRSLAGSPLGPCGPTVGLWVATADGEPRQLTTPCDAPPSVSDVAIEEMWAWSPVGDELAYVRIDGETDELFLIDPSDGSRTSLGTGTVAPDYTGGWGRLASSLAWSPDGSQIAYADGGSLYAVDVASGDRSLLGDSFDFRITSIAFSPDGTQLLVSHHVLDEGQCCLTRMQVMNADGSDLHVVLQDAEDATWSPNGDRIVYQNMSNGSNVPMQVWTISPDGSDPVKVFDGDGCEMGDDPHPVWAPDGTRVALGGCGPGTWVIANADGTGTPQPIDELVWRSWYSGGLTGSDLARMGSGIQFPRA